MEMNEGFQGLDERVQEIVDDFYLLIFVCVCAWGVYMHEVCVCVHTV